MGSGKEGMKRCLVTGGAGFIGSALVRHLLLGKEIASGVGRVVVLDKLTYAGRRENLAECSHDSRFRFVQGDIAESDRVGKLLEEEAIDSVFHLAAESHVDRSIEGPEAFIQTNLVGTYRLLQAARERQKKMKNGQDFRFLHVSTDEVFGTLGADDPAFTEETPYRPNSPYSASKAGSDHLARAWHHTFGLPVIITNLLKQLRDQAVPGEVDSGHNPEGAGGSETACLRGWIQYSGLAVCG
jgi:dTDP-glucose 4,6-dehydratase